MSMSMSMSTVDFYSASPHPPPVTIVNVYSYYAIGQKQNETVKLFIIPDIITGTRSGHVLPILLPHVGASTLSATRPTCLC